MLRTASPPTATPVRHPLGPLLERVGVRSGWKVRGYALAVAAIGMTLLGTAISLRPDPKGYGTHRQLGYPPCGMMVMTGLPCPTCGMTTSFSHTVRGQWISAMAAQPAGFLLCLATGVAVLAGWFVALTGSMYNLNWFRVRPIPLIMFGLFFLLGSWGYKIASVLLDVPVK